MAVTLGKLVVWLIVGGFVGAVVGRLATRSKEGYGRVVNTLLGMAGAIVGGGLFQIFKIDLGLGELKVTFEDLVAAFIGSVFLLVVCWGVRTKKKLLFWIGTAGMTILVVVVLVRLSR
ncbi:MAG: GlsB/YeaQ/YmgE family stress response membrane protein [Planctomycetales bacterium]|nr:GlsB/YeaQ/YmgE family stress response membrane protein [Planctomycetales bacterium]NIM08153.1 GlsB/YeaQ/YmgE family stress response membrane protein [Planctomycetales bacterium]NIN07645.1 GlsB/YeaQ/YmgE family stress response membrane protein [Planctomycetales bacterium]NIN76762.1 GlsB/YeaQ/YmgE family stress response membrane protein [Planctomycetales bacterium]NIO33971.1 GlsB/YeaQ/YmgE family stress response membrane protein [Planctomycetales bacterium]